MLHLPCEALITTTLKGWSTSQSNGTVKEPAICATHARSLRTCRDVCRRCRPHFNVPSYLFVTVLTTAVLPSSPQWVPVASAASSANLAATRRNQHQPVPLHSNLHCGCATARLQELNCSKQSLLAAQAWEVTTTCQFGTATAALRLLTYYTTVPPETSRLIYACNIAEKGQPTARDANKQPGYPERKCTMLSVQRSFGEPSLWGPHCSNANHQMLYAKCPKP